MDDNDELVIVRKNLSDGTWRVHVELTEDELRAIGEATVQWAYLEHALLIETLRTAEKCGVSVPQDATKTSFTKRLRAWRILVEEAISDEDYRERATRLIGRISNAEQRRHMITHGLWNWDRDNPDRLSAYSFRAPHAFNQHFDVKKLSKLSDEIASINFDLTFPRGVVDIEPALSLGRFERLGLAQTIPIDPHPPPATPPEPDEQQ